MIYDRPDPGTEIDQGDLIDAFPLAVVRDAAPTFPTKPVLENTLRRIIVMTQTCDLANAKTTVATVAEVFPAESLVAQGLFKAADVRGPLRGGRIWGVYYLPADANLGLDESIVDFRQLHTGRISLLRDWCAAGRRLARVQPLYREHLARHFAETFGRIGLPRPYETL